MKKIAWISCVALALILINQLRQPQKSRPKLTEIRAQAEKINPEAQVNLGISYYKGEGVAKDYVEAAKPPSRITLSRKSIWGSATTKAMA